MSFPVIWRRTLEVLQERYNILRHELRMRNNTIQRQVDIIAQLKGDNTRQRKELEHLRNTARE